MWRQVHLNFRLINAYIGYTLVGEWYPREKVESEVSSSLIWTFETVGYSQRRYIDGGLPTVKNNMQTGEQNYFLIFGLIAQPVLV